MKLFKSGKYNFNEILKRCSKGDRKAQEHLFQTYYGYVIGIALRYSNGKDAASEITNDAFLKVFQNIEKHQTDKDFKTWLRKITVNTALDYYRKNKKYETQLTLDNTIPEPANTSVLDTIGAEEIIAMLHDLPDVYRHIFNLYEIEGYSHKEIGLQLRITESTSRSGLTRAKKMLRSIILEKIVMKEFDKHMTDRFRELLENYEAEYSPTAWESLREQLDRQEPKTRSNKFKNFIWAGLMICLAATVYFLYPDIKKENSIDHQSIQKTEKMKLEAVVPQTNNPSTSFIQAEVKNTHPTKQQKAESKKAFNKMPTLIIKKQALAAEIIEEKPFNFPLIESLQKIKIVADKQNKDVLHTIPLTPVIFEKDTLKTIKNKSNGGIKLELPRLSLKGIDHAFYKKFLGPNRINIYWAPEFHNYPVFNESRLSTGFGIEMEGPISNMAGISVGVNYQQNSFSKELKDDAFSSAAIPRNNDEFQNLTQIFDSTAVKKYNYQYMEIPVSLNMYFLKTKRSKLGLKLGLSAIFFLKEEFASPFRSLSDQMLYLGENSTKAFENIHWLGSFNAGILYQYQLSNRIYFIADAQYKIGINKFGTEQLKMNKPGLQLGVSYRFGRDEQ